MCTALVVCLLYASAVVEAFVDCGAESRAVSFLKFSKMESACIVSLQDGQGIDVPNEP